MAGDQLRDTIGKNVKNLRLAQGMTQEQVAREVGMTWRNYQRYEKGKIVPRNENLEKLAKVFGVEPAVILGQMPGPHGIEQNVQQLARTVAVLEAQVHELVAWRRDTEAELARRSDIVIDA